MKGTKGITLIALVITIIVMLILVAITLTIAINGGIFDKATDAERLADIKETQNLIYTDLTAEIIDRESRLKLEDVTDILNKYVEQNYDENQIEIDKINGKLKFTGINFNTLTKGYEFELKELDIFEVLEKGIGSGSGLGELKIGDYVHYVPTGGTFNWSSQENGMTYSDYATSKVWEGYGYIKNTGTITTEQLEWRVLDTNGPNGKVRLISNQPTSSTILLGGYQGYNNGTYLLDTICDKLYSGDIGTAQSIRLEDIIEHAIGYNGNSETFIKSLGNTYYGTTNSLDYPYNPELFHYPIMLLDEKDQIITGGVSGTQGKKINPSEQVKLIKQTDDVNATGLTLKNTWWSWYVLGNTNVFEGTPGWPDFYHDIFFRRYYYWIATRGVNIEPWMSIYYIASIHGCEDMVFNEMYNCDQNSPGYNCALRPIITLNSTVKTVDGDGTQGNPWILE